MTVESILITTTNLLIVVSQRPGHPRKTQPLKRKIWEFILNILNCTHWPRRSLKWMALNTKGPQKSNSTLSQRLAGQKEKTREAWSLGGLTPSFPGSKESSPLSGTQFPQAYREDWMAQGGLSYHSALTVLRFYICLYASAYSNQKEQVCSLYLGSMAQRIVCINTSRSLKSISVTWVIWSVLHQKPRLIYTMTLPSAYTTCWATFNLNLPARPSQSISLGNIFAFFQI